MNLRTVMSGIRQGLLVMMWLVVAACGEQEPIEGYITEITAQPGSAPDPVPPLAPYQPLAYHAGLQRSPFMAVEKGSLLPEPPPRTRPGLALDCAQGVAGPLSEALAGIVLPALALRATFIESHHHRRAALIQVAGADTQIVTIGQQLELAETGKQLEVIAISSQQVILRQQLVPVPGCEQAHTTTLELY